MSCLLHAGAMLAYTKLTSRSVCLRKLIFKLFRRVRLSVVLLQDVMALKLESGLTLDLPTVHALVHRLEYVDIRQPIGHCPRMLHPHFGLGTVPTPNGSHHIGMDVPHPHFPFTNSVHCWRLSLLDYSFTSMS